MGQEGSLFLQGVRKAARFPGAGGRRRAAEGAGATPAGFRPAPGASKQGFAWIAAVERSTAGKRGGRDQGVGEALAVRKATKLALST